MRIIVPTLAAGAHALACVLSMPAGGTLPSDASDGVFGVSNQPREGAACVHTVTLTVASRGDA